MALSWDEIVERGKQHNKTVICEVEKRGEKRYFKVKCDICEFEKEKAISKFNECKNCSIKNNSLNKEIFIIKAKKIHGDKYNYDLVEYVNTKTKVKILCNICNNIFEQNPNGHLCGNGCTPCNIEIRNKKISISKDEFLLRSKNTHGDKYNYDYMNYVNGNTKVKIFCNTCNDIFEQKPSNHLQGDGCRKCGYNLLNNKFRLSNDEFISKSKNIHGNKYNYDLVDYINTQTKVKIKCNSCNFIFEQKPYLNLSGCGCPKCNESKGEIKIARYLSDKNIKFIPQKTFQTLRDIRPLKCDFYLEDLNLLIEYDGSGHFKPGFCSDPEKKQKNLEDVQRRDKIKNEWARKNNIPLLRIPYWDYDRIEELIDAFILEHTRKKEVKQLVLEM